MAAWTVVLGLALLAVSSEASNSSGSPSPPPAGCPCKATPANPQQQSATGKPAYVGQMAAYGWGCAAHDANNDTCATANTADGQAADWCVDQWCIVDENDCTFKARKVSYTAEPNDYFSYKACDSSFAGNGWVGRCKNCEAGKETSFCTCGGLAGCPCKTGAVKQESATGKPAYVGTAEAYGSGCKAHDKGEDACATNPTTAGTAYDWCEDQWCIIDKNNCNFKTLQISYTKDATDYFSYETCDANFTGNGWVGRCKCADKSNSYCTCTTTAAGGSGGSGGSGTTNSEVIADGAWCASASLAILVSAAVFAT